MYFGQGLYVTVMGMGLVFLSLAILLFAIKGLDRLFPARAGAPEETSAPATAPIAQAAVTASAPAQPPAPSSEFEAAVSGRRYTVAVVGQSNGSRQVVVDGAAHEVKVDASPSGGIVIDGRAYHAEVLEARPGRISVRVEGATYEVELPDAPAPSAVPATVPPESGAAVAVGEPVPAPLPGKILRVSVVPGARVERGQEVCVLEAMKMENSLRAHRPGVVREVRATAGQTVVAGEPLIILA